MYYFATIKLQTLVLLIFFSLALPAQDQLKAWRLDSAFSTPHWLSISGNFRARAENLDERFRLGRTGSDQAIMLRTTLKSEVVFGELTLGGEMIDSRAYFNDTDSNINTTIVNTTELLQGYLKWEKAGLISPDSQTTLRLGRVTIDVGSRRFVARNRFRNTINSFTGLDWQWQANSGREVRAFYLLPVQRMPADRSSLLDNEAEFDDESSDVALWGFYYKLPVWRQDFLELFVFGLHEEDSASRPTADRELITPGFRIFRPARLGHWDYQLESAFQVGESRSSNAASNVTDLDHLAHFHHVETGYSFIYSWQLRLVVQYDYASGDDSPQDRDNNRFDTLFGARRFDFGPTSIYGAFARANISSPGLRLELKPSASMSSFVSYRGFWLASDRDTWTTSGLRDATGRSGSFLGQQVELRMRYNLRPDNAQIEMGIAHLFVGDFVENASSANDVDDITYLYSQLSLAF